MSRKEFLELILMGVKLNLIMAEDEHEKTLSIIHGAVIESLLINEHLDITDIDACMQDEAIQCIVDRTDEEIVHDLLNITRKLYIEDLEEEFCKKESEGMYLI